MMRPFDIFIFFVAWGKEGKRRPVLVYSLTEGIATIYPITTKYESKSKSEAIRARYFKIEHWRQAGLDRASYIDVGTRLKQSTAMFDGKIPIGRLTLEDRQALMRFLPK